MNRSDFASHEQATALPFAKLVHELTRSLIKGQANLANFKASAAAKLRRLLGPVPW